MRAMVRESMATGQARSSELHIVTKRGPEVTKFGFDPNHEKPFMIDYPTTAGPRVRKRFATIDKYHEWYAKQHGKVASLGEIPDDFEGPRDKPSADFDVEEPTVPGKRRPAGTTARTPGHQQPIKQTLADAGARTVEEPNAATAVDPRAATSVYGGPEAHAETVPPPLAATVEDPQAATAVDVRPAASVDSGSAALAETLPTRPADTASSVSEPSRSAGEGTASAEEQPTPTRWDDMALPERAGGQVAPWQETDPDAPNPLRPEGPLAEGQADWQALPAAQSLKETPHGTFDDVGLPSVPRGAEFGEDQAARFQIGAPPEGGLSAATGSVIVTDQQTGKQYLFKPESAEVYVRRAAARGIRQGEYATRASAAAQVGQNLGLPTPNVTLVRIGSQRGSLTEWVPHGKTLKQIAQENPTLFMSIVNSSEYGRLRADIDAFDFLINNIDRNGGNLIAQLGPNNELLRLVPIDHDLAFTATPERAVIRNYANEMPTAFSEQTVRNLEQMSRNRQQLSEALGPLVGWEAIPGVMQRLDQLLAAANASAGR